MCVCVCVCVCVHALALVHMCMYFTGGGGSSASREPLLEVGHPLKEGELPDKGDRMAAAGPVLSLERVARR